MNTVRELPASEWQRYFDEISKALKGERAVVEIEGLAFGDRTQARSVPLFGITYDSRDDVLEIAMEGLDHPILRPREIVVSEGAEGLERVDIIDANEQKQDVRMVKPLRHSYRNGIA